MRLDRSASDHSPLRLRLPLPEVLPLRRADLAAAVVAATATATPNGGLAAAFAEPSGRDMLRARLNGHYPSESARHHDTRHHESPSWAPGPPTGPALAEQIEHDHYFSIERTDGDPARGFTASLILAYLAAYENCLSTGVTLMGPEHWDPLSGGLSGLFGAEHGGLPRRPAAGYRDGYDPAARWLVGHQLFFVLIQGSVIGLTSFGSAADGWDAADEPTRAMTDGLELAASFLRGSAAAMRFASDFAPEDYDRTVRPHMAPPRVRAGFSGFQTRDHAYLVRLLSALKPALTALNGRSGAHKELVDAVVAAYSAHEFVCARFRGDVLPSLRMAAASRGRTGRAGVEVVRELMRKRLALVDPSGGGAEG